MVQALALNPVAPEVLVVALPNPGEKKTREKIKYKRTISSPSLLKSNPGRKENIVYIIIQTCIRHDDACRSLFYIRG